MGIKIHTLAEAAKIPSPGILAMFNVFIMAINNQDVPVQWRLEHPLFESLSSWLRVRPRYKQNNLLLPKEYGYRFLGIGVDPTVSKSILICENRVYPIELGNIPQ